MHDRGHVWHGGVRGRKMVIAAGGTLPTGMHSCFLFCFCFCFWLAWDFLKNIIKQYQLHSKSECNTLISIFVPIKLILSTAGTCFRGI